MPTVFLSPSVQEFNPYIDGGNEEYYMNLIADAMEPYLTASGIDFVRNNPDTTDGKLDFGTWEQIFYYEMDGMRRKHTLIKIIGE